MERAKNPSWFDPAIKKRSGVQGGPVRKLQAPLIKLLARTDRWHQEYCEPFACAMDAHADCPVVTDPWSGVRGRTA